MGVRRAAVSILANLDEALDIEALARDAGLSVSRFERVFRVTVTENIATFSRRLRLERAAWELSVTDLPVTTIAFHAGYDTHESFTRAFRRAYRLSPSAFRQRMHLHRSRMSHLPDLPYRLPSASSIHVDARHLALTSPMPFREGGGHMSLEIVSRDSAQIAAIAHEGPANMVGEAFGTLAQAAGPAGLFARPGAYGVAVFPPSGGTAFAGVVVDDGAEIPAELVELELAGGLYATVTHVGDYSALPDAWQGIAADVTSASDLVPDSSRPPFEVYRVADHTDPSALETDLFLPVRVSREEEATRA